MNLEDLKSPWRQFVVSNSVDDIDKMQIYWATIQRSPGNFYQTSLHLIRQMSVYALILVFCQSC